MARPRKFDHDEALRLFTEEGWTVPAIGRLVGVSDAAVRLVCDPSYRERHCQSVRRNGKQGACVDCGATIWNQYTRCVACSHRVLAVSVRETELRCSICGEWKLDSEFPRAGGRITRRERHSVCRGCQAADRQRRRLARSVPCARCGKPRLDHRDGNRNSRDTGLCASCYHARKVAA